MTSTKLIHSPKTIYCTWYYMDNNLTTVRFRETSPVNAEAWRLGKMLCYALWDCITSRIFQVVRKVLPEMHWAMLAPQFRLLPCRRMTPLAQHNQNQQWLYDVNWCYMPFAPALKPWQLQPYHLSNIGTHRIKRISRAKTQKCSQPLLLSCRPIPLRFDLIEVQQLGEEVMSPAATHHGYIHYLSYSRLIGWFQSHFFFVAGHCADKSDSKVRQYAELGLKQPLGGVLWCPRVDEQHGDKICHTNYLNDVLIQIFYGICLIVMNLWTSTLVVFGFWHGSCLLFEMKQSG